MGRSVVWAGVVLARANEPLEEEADVTDSNLCAGNCCPEAPDITIHQTIIQSDGLPQRFRQEKSGVDWTPSGVAPHIVLAATPVSAASVKLFINGSLQMQGVDYTIDGAEITLAQALPSGASAAAEYVSTEEAV